MMSWLWRLAFIALITWVAVPLMMQEEPKELEPTSTGAEVVDSALTVWQRFWANQMHADSVSEANEPVVVEAVDGGLQQQFLQRLLQFPEARQIGRDHVRRQAEEFGLHLTDEDVDRVLDWLQRP
ncbi:hypothetical protein NFC81_07190 [Salinispirillum sp. LH 10-3-1]|uniref:DUF2059 domain-containing protein n=1 Tax=Salinispirillum sp. LH 10-3-1 TaxID=2952525 RepID=A0AB38YJP9_9GAMM